MESSFPAVRFATAADMTAMVSVINAAFAIETFLEGTCTDEERLAELMTQGSYLLGHDRSGHLVASVYVRSAASAVISPCLQLIPRTRARVWDARWSNLQKIIAANKGARRWISVS